MESTFNEFLTELDSDLAPLHMGVIVLRLLAAVFVGAALSLRPWRPLMHRPMPKAEMVHAQVLLCTAAAVMSAVIGNSVAKAFGLVGLGGFVRFRSGLKDPRDAAIFFLMIGLGMACGRGNLGLALVGVAFISALLLVLDLTSGQDKSPKQRVVLSAQAEDLVSAEASLRKALGERNVLVKGCALDFSGRRLELEVEEKDPSALVAALSQTQGAALQGLRWTAVNPRLAREELV